MHFELFIVLISLLVTGKTRTTARQETSSATSRSRSSSSSTTSSRPTSTRPIEKANHPTEEQVTKEAANTPVIVADPVEQRWEEDAGMYTHKKFKKMASSVVVTSVASTPTEPQPPLSVSSSHFSIQQSLPLKHSALSLIETQQQQLRTVHHYQQQQPVSHHPSQRVHVPPPSPSRLVIDEHPNDQLPIRKNVCPYCNNSFAKPSVLEKHIRTHTNERPYPCNPCQIAFKTQSNLYKHSRSKSHELKVHQGIDSSYAEKVAELGDSFKEELDKPSLPPPPPPHVDQARTILISEQQQPRDFRMKATTVAIIPQQNQNHRIVNARIPQVAHLEPPRPVADSIPQHIDKIISHNQTIVETLDPLWTKKFMRHKEDQQQQPSVVTLEKASPARKFVTTNSGQVTMSLVNSKPNHQATMNLVPPGSVQVHHHQSTSASSSPLSIHLARSQPPPPPSHHAHPTLTVVPSGLRLNEQTPFMVVKQTEEAKKAEEMLNAKSVKEVWLNSHNRPSPVAQQPQHLNHHHHQHPNSLEGSMIKELLIKTRGATTLEPAGPIEQNRRDSASSNGSGGSQIVLQVTKAPFEPQMKLLPNVSLILTPTTSTLTASNLTVTSIPMSKSRILPQGLISQAPGISTSTPIYASEVIKVIYFANHLSTIFKTCFLLSLQSNMSQKSFSGTDLELHQQREYGPARIVSSQQQNHIHHHQQQQPSVIAQLREARLPEKHFRPNQELPHEDESPSKKPRLTILPHNQQIPVKTLLNSGGGIVTVSKAPIQPVHHGGLLQIAKPILQSGGRVQVANKSIPGIPVPSMAGLLTGIKNVPSQALFSLPGKRTEIVPGMPGPSKEHVSTIPSSNQNEVVKMDVVKVEADSSKAEGGFLRPNSLPLTPGSFKPKKHVMIIGGDTLVSPETPRPRKSYMLQYQNGTAYTTLGFKSSTKVYYTTIFHQQPMYVANKPRISMYSNWRVVSKVTFGFGCDLKI